MIERRDKGFQSNLTWIFVVIALGVLALYFVVRKADPSTNPDVVNAVKALAAASVAIFIAAATQVANLLPARRQAFRPVLWGLLLALILAAAIAIPVVTIAFSYLSVKALILLGALAALELLLFVLLVLARIEQPAASHVAAFAPMAPPFPAAPPEQLAPAEVIRYEEATLALERATRDHEDAIRETDELARQYEAGLR